MAQFTWSMVACAALNVDRPGRLPLEPHTTGAAPSLYSFQILRSHPRKDILSNNTFHRGFRYAAHDKPFSLIETPSQWVADRHPVETQHPRRLQVLRGKDEHPRISQPPRRDDGNKNGAPRLPPPVQVDVLMRHAPASFAQCPVEIDISAFGKGQLGFVLLGQSSKEAAGGTPKP